MLSPVIFCCFPWLLPSLAQVEELYPMLALFAIAAVSVHGAAFQSQQTR